MDVTTSLQYSQRYAHPNADIFNIYTVKKAEKHENEFVHKTVNTDMLLES